MKLSTVIREHKNTITGVISTLMFLFLSWEWVSGKITFMEYTSYLAVIGGAVGTVVSFLSPDAKSEAAKKEEKAAIIAEIREQLKQESIQPKQENEEVKNAECNCGDASTGCRCLLPKASE